MDSPPAHGPVIDGHPPNKDGLARRWGTGDWVVASLCFLAGLPALIVDYLPLTDLPQHLAIATIIEQFDQPSLRFAEFYQLAFERTLYWLPYGAVIGLGKLLGLALAMRIMVALTLVTYPLGVLAILKSLGRSSWPALLAVPLVYCRPLFIGLTNFHLSIGLSLAAIALLCRIRPRLLTHVALGLIALALTTTHTHGLALTVAFATIALVFEPSRARLLRSLPLLPAVCGAGLWLVLAGQATGYGQSYWPPPLLRLRLFVDETLGGYRDHSEAALLAVIALICLVPLWSRLPLTRTRWRSLDASARALALLMLLNVLLYFLLPAHTKTAKFVHFRHAFMALSLLPVFVVVPEQLRERARWSVCSLRWAFRPF